MSRLWSADFRTLVKKDPTLSLLWNNLSGFTTLDFATIFITLSDSGNSVLERAFGSILSDRNLLFLVSENPWRLFCRELLLTAPKQKCSGSWELNRSGWQEMCQQPEAFWPWLSRWVYWTCVMVLSMTGKEYRVGFLCQHLIPAACQNDGGFCYSLIVWCGRMFSRKSRQTGSKSITTLLVVPHQVLSSQTINFTTMAPTNPSHGSESPCVGSSVSSVKRVVVCPS